MKTLLVFVAGIAAAVILYGMFALAVRQCIALIKGDDIQVDRLSIPYDIAEAMALRDFGTSSEVFELTWNEGKTTWPDLRPYDVYLYFKNGCKW